MRCAVYVLALTIASCTVIDFRDYHQNTDLPTFFTSAPRWEHSDYVSDVVTRGDYIELRSTLPWDVDACIAMVNRPQDCTDDDGDGLVDLWEELALHRLRPVVHLHPNDRLFNDSDGLVAALGRIAPAPGGERIRMFLALAYSRDYGSCTFTAHAGDSERIVLDLQPEERSWGFTVRVAGIYTAAHEGERVDSSTLLRDATLGDVEVVADGWAHNARWAVYASKNKHATYLSERACKNASSLPCVREGCAATTRIGHDSSLLFSVHNAGEPNRPLTTAPGHNSPAARMLPGWSREGFTYTWSEERFCGGTMSSACSSSLRGKLLDDPFE